MPKVKHTKSGTFLLEIILNILLFSILVIISLQFLVKTRALTTKTTILHNAVTINSGLASIYESDGLNGLLNEYHDSKSISPQMVLYYDQNFAHCKKTDAVYRVSIIETESVSELQKCSITFYNNDSEVVNKITACQYTPLTSNHTEVVK